MCSEFKIGIDLVQNRIICLSCREKHIYNACEVPGKEVILNGVNVHNALSLHIVAIAMLTLESVLLISSKTELFD